MRGPALRPVGKDLHARGKATCDSSDRILDYRTSARRSATHVSGVQKQVRGGLTAGDLDAAETRPRKEFEQARDAQGVLDPLRFTARGDAHRHAEPVREMRKGLGNACNRQEGLREARAFSPREFVPEVRRQGAAELALDPLKAIRHAPAAKCGVHLAG